MVDFVLAQEINGSPCRSEDPAPSTGRGDAHRREGRWELGRPARRRVRSRRMDLGLILRIQHTAFFFSSTDISSLNSDSGHPNPGVV